MVGVPPEPIRSRLDFYSNSSNSNHFLRLEVSVSHLSRQIPLPRSAVRPFLIPSACFHFSLPPHLAAHAMRFRCFFRPTFPVPSPFFFFPLISTSSFFPFLAKEITLDFTDSLFFSYSMRALPKPLFLFSFPPQACTLASREFPSLTLPVCGMKPSVPNSLLPFLNFLHLSTLV